MASIPGNTESVIWDSFFSATRAKFLGKPKVQTYRTPKTWNWVKGLQGDQGSGTRCEFAATLGTFSGSTDLPFGSLDTITVQDYEITTTGWVNWFTKAALCGISEQKMKANSGKEKKYSYVDGQLDAMIAGQDDEFETDLWRSTQATDKIQSLAVTLSTTTGSGSPENLSRATYVNWNQIYTNLAGAAFSAAGLNGFRTIYHSLSDIGNFSPPDTIFMSSGLHATYERITDSKEITQMADAGKKGKHPILSEAMVFRGCTIIYIPSAIGNDTTARFVNSSTWHYIPLMSMLPGAHRQPANGLWYAYPVVQSGALVCDALRANGLVGNFLNS